MTPTATPHFYQEGTAERQRAVALMIERIGRGERCVVGSTGGDVAVIIGSVDGKRLVIKRRAPFYWELEVKTA